MVEDEVARAWESLKKKKVREKRDEEEEEAIKEIEENLDEIMMPEEHFSEAGLMREIKEAETPPENLESAVGFSPKQEEEGEQEEQGSLYTPKKEVKYESAEPERMTTFTRFEEPEEIFHRPRKVDLSAVESPFEEYVAEVEEKPPEHRRLDEGDKEFARRYKVRKSEEY